MNIGIVTTWFERGASYVSRQFENVLSKEHNVYIYARGGDKYAIGDPMWDRENVTWGARRIAPSSMTLIAYKDFVKWCKTKKIDIILFNEQDWWSPVLWCNDLGIPTICYVDYYKNNTIPFFAAYSALICNTRRHYSAFSWHYNSHYVPWGTDCSIFKPRDYNFNLVNENIITLFHSCGMDPYRKGTDLLLLAVENLSENFKLIIHTQIDLKCYFDRDIANIIAKLERSGKLEIYLRTVTAPGLYYLGDIYVYPSRLEGIGLTIAEAQACGLIPIVTNNGPMNEFVNTKIGYLIDVKKYYARHDGYYWSECTPDIINLRDLIVDVCKNKDRISKMKKENFKYANDKLNWEKNSIQILEIFNMTKFIPLEESIINKINAFENNGWRKLNQIFLKYYWMMNMGRKLYKWL